MNEKVYLSDLEWTEVHNNMGGVKANIVFNNIMSYEKYKKLVERTFFVLNDINLQTRWDNLREWLTNDGEDDKLEVFDAKDNDSVKLGIMIGFGMVVDKMNKLEGADNNG